MNYEPHPYQQRMQEHILQHPFCGVWAEMGLGKTVVTLTALHYLLATLEINKVLVVAPMRVVQTVWPAEIAKWDHLRGLECTILRGTPQQRKRKLASDAPIHLINYDLLVWLVKQHTKESWPYDCVVLDESSKVKDRSTKRWRALRAVRPFTHRVVELTGTPAPNGLLGLWSQLYLLDRGERLGTTLGAYKRRWFTENPYTWEVTPHKHAGAEIQAAVEDICVSLKTEDYMTLPSLVANRVDIDMPVDGWNVYEELRRTMAIELDGVNGGEVVAVNAAVLVNKLLQVTNGAPYINGKDRTYRVIHDAKLDALDEMVDGATGNILVAYSFISDRERILKRFPQAVALDKDPAIIRKWNDGDIPILLAHPASTGHGLNLQEGGHVAVWFGLPWSLELYQQFNARLHRQGQKHVVMVHHLVVPGTIDEYVLEILDGKETVQEALLEAVKL